MEVGDIVSDQIVPGQFAKCGEVEEMDNGEDDACF